MKIEIHFGHGLGDCVYFAHQLPLYRDHGFEIALSCHPDKRIVFQDSGVEFIGESPGLARVPWYESPGISPMNAEKFWTYNKGAINLSREPLPNIGTPETLWVTLSQQQLNLGAWIDPTTRQRVQSYMQSLVQPVVLVHTMGNSIADWKNLPPDQTQSLYTQLLDKIDGTLILLDWDNRVPRLANWRVRHLTDDWERINTETLLCLLEEADLVLGIDSGPLHATRFTSTPAVGLFPHKDHYPTRWCLPRNRQINMVVAGTNPLNKKTRAAFNILEGSLPHLDPSEIATACARMLEKPRYLEPDQLGQDVLLQQFIREWERGRVNGLSAYVDRDRSYDLLLRETSRRFSSPSIVETGCIRAEEDWGGAGYSTYLLGVYADKVGGKLYSVDISAQNCEFARRVMHAFSSTSITCEDSVTFLSNFGRPIDVLLVDSVDTEHPNAPHHALAEVEAAAKWLHKKSLILFDDTPYFQRQFRGKGTLAVPWLLENGWKILFSGYQTLLYQS